MGAVLFIYSREPIQFIKKELKGYIEITDYNITKTPNQLLNGSDEIVVSKGILIEGKGLCTIFDVEEEYFIIACTSGFELDTIIATQYLRIKVL